MTLSQLLKLVRSDIIRRLESDQVEFSISAVISALFMPSTLVVLNFRFANYFYKKGIYVLTKLLTIMNIVLFSCEIQAGCEIGEGFLISHANGVVIHKNARIGKNCTFMHQSTVGLREREGIPLEELLIVVEDGVLVGAGARIIGPLTVGKYSQIGMNAVLTSSVPPYSVIVGVPGKVIKKLDGKNEEANRSFTQRCGETDVKNTCKAYRTNFRETLLVIREDLQHKARIDGKPFGWFCYVKLFLNPAALAVVVFRFQHLAYCCGLTVVAKILNAINVIVFSVEIGSRAQIAGGLVLGHCVGIVINGNSVIGKNCVFFHHNTVAIGPRAGLDPDNDRVVIGDEVIVGAGARVFGNITIGHHSIIGMNAVVTRSIPPYSVVAGVPARVIKKVRKTNCESEESSSEKDRRCLMSEQKRKRVGAKETLRLIKADVEFRYKLEDKPFNAMSFVKVLFNPPAMAVVIFRLQHWFATHWMPFVAKLLAICNILFFSVDIGSKAKIDEGLIIAHASGILIGDFVEIGKRCIFTSQNSLAIGPREGLRTGRNKMFIGDDVFFGVGARVVGPVNIGSNSTFGMNCVVTRDIPSNSVVVGIPGRILKRKLPDNEEVDNR